MNSFPELFSLIKFFMLSSFISSNSFCYFYEGFYFFNIFVPSGLLLCCLLYPEFFFYLVYPEIFSYLASPEFFATLLLPFLAFLSLSPIWFLGG